MADGSLDPTEAEAALDRLVRDQTDANADD